MSHRATSRTNPPFVATVALVLAGCAADVGPSEDAQVRDSAGVTIVENGEVKEMPTAFRIAVEPTLELGGARGEPDEELNPRAPFHDAVRLSDGRHVVVDYQDLKVFGADGRYLRTIGRAGEGPGEFGQVLAACVAPGDTIIAVHYGIPRVSVFDPTGEHVRTFMVDASYVDGAGCFADGSVLALARGRPNPESVLPADEAAVLDRVATVRRIARDGRDLGVAGIVPTATTDWYF